VQDTGVTRLHRRPSVERSTPYFSEIFSNVYRSPGSRESKFTIASSIGAIVVELSRVEVFGGAGADSGHKVHGHGTVRHLPFLPLQYPARDLDLSGRLEEL
jgi:hypothetical protein